MSLYAMMLDALTPKSKRPVTRRNKKSANRAKFKAAKAARRRNRV